MPDRSHAIAAESRASGKPVEAQVDRKAHQLYPDLGKSKAKRSDAVHHALKYR